MPRFASTFGNTHCKAAVDDLYPAAFTVRDEAVLIIRMRKTNKREIKQYEQA
jgi:uncharacterized DUF497 family protein